MVNQNPFIFVWSAPTCLRFERRDMSRRGKAGSSPRPPNSGFQFALIREIRGKPFCTLALNCAFCAFLRLESSSLAPPRGEGLRVRGQDFKLQSRSCTKAFSMSAFQFSAFVFPGKLSVADGIARFFFVGWLRCGQGCRRLGHFIDHTLEIFQARDGNDDRVAFGSHHLRDAQKPAARIFLERHGDELAFDLQLGGLDGVFLDEGPGRLLVAGLLVALALIRTVAVRRGTFV